MLVAEDVVETGEAQCLAAAAASAARVAQTLLPWVAAEASA